MALSKAWGWLQSLLRAFPTISLFKLLNAPVILVCYELKNGYINVSWKKKDFIYNNRITHPFTLVRLLKQPTVAFNCYFIFLSCVNFWDEAWWFLSLTVFGLLSSSLLLFPQCFGRYVLRPSSSVCRTRELRTTFLYWIHRGRLFWFRLHNRVQVLSIPVLLLASSQDWTLHLQMIVSLEA